MTLDPRRSLPSSAGPSGGSPAGSTVPPAVAAWAPTGRPVGWLARIGLLLPVAATVAAAAWQAVQVRTATAIGRRVAARARAVQQNPQGATSRLLLVGDSTGVGVGAHAPSDSLAGLLAREHPLAHIVNRCRNGARTADLPAQFEDLERSGERFDLVLVLAGGNDVLRLTPPLSLEHAAQAAMVRLKRLGRTVVWVGSANVGGSPRLLPPLAWLAERQTRRCMQRLARTAERQQVQFIDFFQPRADDLFARQPQRYFAEDGIHPSSASYAHCYTELKRQVALAERLGPAG